MPTLIGRRLSKSGKSIMPLRVQLDEVFAKAEAKLDKFTIEFLQDLNERLVENTGPNCGIRVITGFLRGSWSAAIGQEFEGEGGTPDPSGAGSLARMNLVAAQMKYYQKYYAVNGASYAGFVHWGTTKMAGRPWVTITMQQAPEIAAAALAKVMEE